MPWLIPAVVALIGAVGNGIGAANDIDKARKDAQDQLTFIDELYTLQTDKARQDFEEAQKQAQKNADEANRQADIADKEADYTDKLADITDLGQNLQERALSNDFNTAIDNLYLSQLSDTWSYNNASMQAGSSKGASLASIAGSGIRAGSSLSDAVLMESATNEAQIQFSQDAKRRSDNNSLASILNGLAGNRYNIMQTRIGADWDRTQAGFTRENAAVTRQNALDLINSYAEGGYNYNIYQNQLAQMQKTNAYNKNQLQKQINENSWDSSDAWLKLGTGILTGAGSGLTTGYELYDMTYKAAEYGTDITDIFKKKNNKSVVYTNTAHPGVGIY